MANDSYFLWVGSVFDELFLSKEGGCSDCLSS